LKLAQPDRRIVQVIAMAAFISPRRQRLCGGAAVSDSVLTVVLDNGGWQAVKSAVQRFIRRHGRRNRPVSIALMSAVRRAADFATVGRAFGAHGECVRERMISLRDRPLLAALDHGKAAVLHVHITRL